MLHIGASLVVCMCGLDGGCVPIMPSNAVTHFDIDPVIAVQGSNTFMSHMCALDLSCVAVAPTMMPSCSGSRTLSMLVVSLCGAFLNLTP